MGIYDRIRPLVTGGLDLSPAYAFPWSGTDDVIVDVGCGTGDALDYLEGYREYHGFDPDARAIDHLRRRRPRPGVHVYDRELGRADIERIRPTAALLVGVFHHLSDQQVLEVLDVLGTGGHVRGIRTLDVRKRRGDLVNNAFVAFDRGKYVRSAEALEALISRSPFRVADRFSFSPRIKIVSYLVLALEPQRQNKAEPQMSTDEHGSEGADAGSTGAGGGRIRTQE
ncbi:MAG: class I SAM-dependent methyltransferase [Candidatus Latescibacteria bacterium]|nr:class I SAM-dependent methyltransferase [Candidatus Latescibacterota bacterium]